MWGRLNRVEEVGVMEVKVLEVRELEVWELEVKALEVKELEVPVPKEVGGRVDGKPKGRNSWSG